MYGYGACLPLRVGAVASVMSLKNVEMIMLIISLGMGVTDKIIFYMIYLQK